MKDHQLGEVHKMSLIYNNGKPIGRCESYEIEKVQGTSDFIKINNFSFLNSLITENQQMLLDWMLDETEDVQEYSFQPTGIISELTGRSKLVNSQLRELWICMEEQKRQQVIMRFLAIKNDMQVGNEVN
ncbi:hypothetical protein D931_02810 [Enterococcus faecium 13.SD.W.09]|nr:hypothetical protein D931_02810 [Enterococcus faecium 13.SD.W.09]